MTDPIDIERIRLSPLLVGLHDVELQALVNAGHPVTYEADSIVVKEGSPGDALYHLRDGEVRVEKEVEGADSVELAVLGESGSFFGEMVFVDVMPRSATVRTTRQTNVLAFPLEVLHDFFRSFGDARQTILLNIARELSKRLRQADVVIAGLKSRA
jgi:CRP-like cAMP-binding protein